MLINVRDFASVQDALNAAHSGDRVYFPSLYGSTPGHYLSPSGGWTINKNLEVFGDGAGSRGDDSGTTVKPNSANDHVFVVTTPRENLHFHDFKIKLDSQPGSGSGNGIHCVTTTNNKVEMVTVERVDILNLGNDGLHFEGIDSDEAAIVFLRVVDCHVGNCRGTGAYLRNCGACLGFCVST